MAKMAESRPMAKAGKEATTENPQEALAKGPQGRPSMEAQHERSVERRSPRAGGSNW